MTALSRIALNLVASARIEGEVGTRLLLPWTVWLALMMSFIGSSSSSSESSSESEVLSV